MEASIYTANLATRLGAVTERARVLGLEPDHSLLKKSSWSCGLPARPRVSQRTPDASRTCATARCRFRRDTMSLRLHLLTIGLILLAVMLVVRSLPDVVSAQFETHPRTAVSYLRGPFAVLHVAVRFTRRANGREVTHVDHLTVRDQAVLAHLVRLVNKKRTISSFYPPCPGRIPTSAPLAGPEWLSFIRPNGSQANVFYSNPCFGFFIHGVRVEDPEQLLWRTIVTLVSGRG
jgi:hypothetical protein